MSSSTMTRLSKQRLQKLLAGQGIYIPRDGDPALHIKLRAGKSVRVDEVEQLINDGRIVIGEPEVDDVCYEPKGSAGGPTKWVRHVTWVKKVKHKNDD